MISEQQREQLRRQVLDAQEQRRRLEQAYEFTAKARNLLRVPAMPLYQIDEATIYAIDVACKCQRADLQTAKELEASALALLQEGNEG